LTPHFYPRLYIQKQQRYSAPASLAALEFPSIVDYWEVFGANPYPQLHETHFEYEFTNVSTVPWVFYTVAIYQHNWGLTDRRKSEYQIRVAVDRIPRCEAVICESDGSATPKPSSSARGPGTRIKRPDASEWEWLDLDDGASTGETRLDEQIDSATTQFIATSEETSAGIDEAQ
jgi:hypothetical protein